MGTTYHPNWIVSRARPQTDHLGRTSIAYQPAAVGTVSRIALMLLLHNRLDVFLTRQSFLERIVLHASLSFLYAISLSRCLLHSTQVEAGDRSPQARG